MTQSSFVPASGLLERIARWGRRRNNLAGVSIVRWGDGAVPGREARQHVAGGRCVDRWTDGQRHSIRPALQVRLH